MIVLKEQLLATYQSLKPLNILKNTLKDAVTSPGIIGDILGTTVGLATGYLSKKVMVGTSHNMFRKIIGSILQFGVTNVVARHPDDIKTIGQSILHSIFHKKETTSKKS